MACSHCGKKVFARGLCQSCYYRLRRNGSVERKNVINSGKCAVDGCDNPAFAKNLCQSHYNKADHPLKAIWKLLRSRHPGEYPKAWENFETFLADVGLRPSKKHQLRRLNAAEPFSGENIVWLAPIGSKYGRDKGWLASYGREWHLKRKFGISVAEYDTLLSQQNGVCAICGNKESHAYKSGKLKELSVDHCHNSKKVRGLLCMKCNRGIGYFDDSIERIRRTIAYLEKYQT